MHPITCNRIWVYISGVAPGIFRLGADSSDEGAKIWFSGYYKCQKSPKKSLFTFRRGAIAPLVLLWRHPWLLSCLITNPECAKTYTDDNFRIIGQARSSFHLGVLESVYIKTQNPVLCRQKEFVFFLKLFN